MVHDASADMLIRRGENAMIRHVAAVMELAPAGEDFLRTLYRLAHETTNGVIVELGAYVGRSAIALAWDARVPVFSIDDYANHVDWSGRAYNADNEAAYRQNTLGAGVNTVLIKSDVREAARKWDAPIGLLVWDVSESNRLLDDWLAWREHIALDGRALLRDTFDKRLGSNRVISYEFSQKQFAVESHQPGLLTLRRYE